MAQEGQGQGEEEEAPLAFGPPAKQVEVPHGAEDGTSLRAWVHSLRQGWEGRSCSAATQQETQAKGRRGFERKHT